MKMSRGRRVAGLAAVVITALGSMSGVASGQLAPERLYYGVRGRIEMEVRRPAAAASEVGEAGGEAWRRPASLEIALVDGTGVVDRAPVVEGRVDVASLFPRVWTAEKPVVMYAQLLADDRAAGPAVVLQPMVSPERAAAGDARGTTIRFVPGVPEYFAGVRAYVEKRVVLETSAGEIEVALRPEAAPNTSWNFRHLAEGGFYTGVTFHRIVAGESPERGFVVQAGDPLGTGVGGPGYSIDLERSTLAHDAGVVSMARLSQPDTGGSQFFICLSREKCRALDGSYAAFGVVSRGMEVVQSMAREPVDSADRPLSAPVIRNVRLVDAPPRVIESGERTRAPETNAPGR